MDNAEFSKYDLFAKRMADRFPEMFGDGWYGGFAVGEGWWPILEALCANIQSHINWKNDQGVGCPPVVVVQIKEKFGGLRFYYNGGDDTIGGMVQMAEAWAASSCEECGKPGIQRGGGWVRTLCDEHEAEYQARQKERSK